ncbi:MAG: isopentenyl phosphate kinase [Anaerolineales bacterium]|nr:isopentenyl phosphate kinase [Anaerolineales bacterium]MCS7247615.1 isopentenyl phosphate kinase [Anaerolineales bacterium]MDW8161426.1 isopentenyl phosphate kinase [Anaerolineales bacterium]MDW8447653.1 isopentenyl phosphate kinase [Anaerolineales bacterium]
MAQSLSPLIFLKLGGSLITEKHRPYTARLETLRRLAEEIAHARQSVPELRLVVGHGAGSFGHVPAKRYGTRQGVHTPEEWLGFAEVWREAATLNRLVVEALLAAKLPVISLPPCASVTAEDGKVAVWELYPIRAALQAGLLPLIFGDVVFDRHRGGTILSTEDLFEHLARQLRPRRILLAGIEEGVWSDFPQCTQLVREITPADLYQGRLQLGGSQAPDVTGGMESKVRQSLAWVQELPELEVLIFNGEKPGAVRRALMGETLGTRIHAGR